MTAARSGHDAAATSAMAVGANGRVTASPTAAPMRVAVTVSTVRSTTFCNSTPRPRTASRPVVRTRCRSYRRAPTDSVRRQWGAIPLSATAVPEPTASCISPERNAAAPAATRMGAKLTSRGGGAGVDMLLGHVEQHRVSAEPCCAIKDDQQQFSSGEPARARRVGSVAPCRDPPHDGECGHAGHHSQQCHRAGEKTSPRWRITTNADAQRMMVVAAASAGSDVVGENPFWFM